MIDAKHPAKYSDTLLPIFERLLEGYDRVLDPFGGTGKLRKVVPNAYLIEIEYEWARFGNGITGNALYLPFPSSTFDAICTSVAYGNRMADTFTDYQINKNYKRNTYRHMLGRPLHKDNSGGMQWGDTYRAFHVKAWNEIARVLKSRCRLVLNVSDHIRKGERQYVSLWHLQTLENIGFKLIERYEIETPRQRYGKNGNVRVECEYVFVFERGNNAR